MTTTPRLAAGPAAAALALSALAATLAASTLVASTLAAPAGAQAASAALAGADCRQLLPADQVGKAVGHDVKVKYSRYPSVLASTCEFVPTKKGVTPLDYDGNSTTAFCIDDAAWRSYEKSVRNRPDYEDVRTVKVAGAAHALMWSVSQDFDDHHYAPVWFVAAHGTDGSLADVHLWGLSQRQTKKLGTGLLKRTKAARAASSAACP